MSDKVYGGTPKQVVSLCKSCTWALVATARRLVIGKTFEDKVGEEENAKWCKRRCVYVKLAGLELLDRIDA
jgi:hypothetical protein